MNTRFPAFLLRVALKRDGIWFINLEGDSTQFVHNACRHKLGLPPRK